MTSFSAGGQGMGSEEGVVHHGEMQGVKQDSTSSNTLRVQWNISHTHRSTTDAPR